MEHGNEPLRPRPAAVVALPRSPRRTRPPSKEIGRTFDHGEQTGYGLWLDARPKDIPSLHRARGRPTRRPTVRSQAPGTRIRQSASPGPPADTNADAEESERLGPQLCRRPGSAGVSPQGRTQKGPLSKRPARPPFCRPGRRRGRSCWAHVLRRRDRPVPSARKGTAPKVPRRSLRARIASITRSRPERRPAWGVVDRPQSQAPSSHWYSAVGEAGYGTGQAM